MLMMIPLYSAEKQDSIKSWKFGGRASVNFSQVLLTNWAAGGRSSTSGVALFNLSGNYKKDHLSWENSLDMGCGLLNVNIDSKVDLFSDYFHNPQNVVVN